MNCPSQKSAPLGSEHFALQPPSSDAVQLPEHWTLHWRFACAVQLPLHEASHWASQEAEGGVPSQLALHSPLQLASQVPWHSAALASAEHDP